jgi:hypothetical protein
MTGTEALWATPGGFLPGELDIVDPTRMLFARLSHEAYAWRIVERNG